MGEIKKMTDSKLITRQPQVRKVKTYLKAEKVKDKMLTKGVKRKLKGLIHKSSVKARHGEVIYVPSKGVDDFVIKIHAADPLRLIETERVGVAGVFVKDLSKRMEIPAQKMFLMLGVPKATAEKKVSSGELLSGNGGRAALGMAKLLGVAQEIVENSTAAEAKNFDSAKWLGQWLEKPQPALGGRKPCELIDTPTGLEIVAKLLGAIESGAYL